MEGLFTYIANNDPQHVLGKPGENVSQPGSDQGAGQALMSFIGEMDNFAKGLSGAAAKGKSDALPLMKSILPVVNNFLAIKMEINKQGKKPVSAAYLREKLSKLVTDLTNTMTGIGGGISISDEVNTPATSVVPGSTPAAASGTLPWSGQGDPVDKFLERITDIKTLTSIRDKAHAKIEQLSAIPKASAVVSSKLKLGISEKK
jgi:hypothetical protein